MKNKKRQLKLPKRSLLTYILLIIIPIAVFFLIAIPVQYINAYNSNKVTPFSSDLKDQDTSDIIYGNKDTIKDFNFMLYCTSYDDNSGSVSFKAFAYENENTSDLKINNTLEVKLGMCSDWIKTDLYSSSRTGRKIAASPKIALSSSSYYMTFSISNVPNMPKAGSLPFININTIPLYAFVKYSANINGSKITKRYILKYEYEDYVIGQIVLDDPRTPSVQVDGDYIQYKYDSDTKWTNLTTVASVENIDARIDGEYIQWKKESDTSWTNLQALSELSGYSSDKSVELSVNSQYILWRYTGDTDWKNLKSISELLLLDVRTSDGYVQWKYKTDTNWHNLLLVSSIEKPENKATIPPTTGGIER